MVEQVVLYFVGGLFVTIFHICCWYKLLGVDVNLKQSKFYVSLLVLCVFGTILAFTVPKYMKIIITIVLYLLMINFYLFEKDLKKSLCMVLISQIIVMISELILVITISLLFKSSIETFSMTMMGGLLINLFIAILSFMFLIPKSIKTIFNYLDSSMDFMKKKEVLTYCIMIIAVAIISTAESYMNFPTEVVLTTNTIMALIFIFMVVKFAKSEDKYNRVNSKYQTSITSLNEYGNILDKYRVVTHENKNQLLTIQKMTKDKNVIKYIDALLDEKIKDNEKVMNKTFKIPDGGFRSIIYAKVCKIDELKIKYKLNIANDVKTVDLINMNEYLVRDACTILGVYLDNAIEAVKELKKKNIFIEIYVMDNYLCFDITNNFEGVLDISKIVKPKYTTKGEGHGYGLALVNKISEENENIKNECEVVNNMITQRVKIKM